MIFRIRLGSPPLTRGKGYMFLVENGRLRITPAYAGKSDFCSRCCTWPWDHPRLRGEKYNMKISISAMYGSPPLTRGKERRNQKWKRNGRITPAYAGKRETWIFYHGSAQDHPRLRGEKIFKLFLLILFLGSPPLTRGKGMLNFPSYRALRITPAYAGKR